MRALILGLLLLAFPCAAERYIVMPKAGAKVEQVLAKHGVVGKKTRGRFVVIEATPQQAQDVGLERGIKFVEEDRLMPPIAIPNDPKFSSQWAPQKINAPSAWNTTQGQGVTIAILDTGIDCAHPDLRCVAGWNFYDDDANTADVYGHGTGVAGVAAATYDNGVGVAGIAGAARVMPLRVSDANGFALWSTVAEAVRWAADNGVRVANLSYQAAASLTVQDAAAYLQSKGGLLTVASGNTGGLDSSAPTDYLLDVSSTDSDDTLSAYSTYGDIVNIAAPGNLVLTTTRGGGYASAWGTSFAAPAVAGVAALAFSVAPQMTSGEAMALLTSTALDLGTTGRDQRFGYGRVDAGATVAALGCVPVQDVTPPTVSISSPVGGSTVAGTVAIGVNANDDFGVVLVELRANGALIASDNGSPWGFDWDSTSFPDGPVALEVRAYDAAGNNASASVNVTTANAGGPSVAITTPLDGATVSGNVSITIVAGTTIKYLLIKLDGVNKFSSSNRQTLTWVWNSSTATPGPHTITGFVRDDVGRTATASITVIR